MGLWDGAGGAGGTVVALDKVRPRMNDLLNQGQAMPYDEAELENLG